MPAISYTSGAAFESRDSKATSHDHAPRYGGDYGEQKGFVSHLEGLGAFELDSALCTDTVLRQHLYSDRCDGLS